METFRKKDAYWFSHDSNAKDDPKIMILIEQLGLEGYGIYWVLVETLREQPGYKCPIILIPVLARRYGTSAEKMKAVVLNYDLFVIEDDKFFFSESLINRMQILENRREVARRAGIASGEKRKSLNVGSTYVQHAFNDSSTITLKERKEKKSKIKDNNCNDNGNARLVIDSVDIENLQLYIQKSLAISIQTDELKKLWEYFKLYCETGFITFKRTGAYYRYFLNWLKSPKGKSFRAELMLNTNE